MCEKLCWNRLNDGGMLTATSWRTSVFPDTHREAFVLPIKRTVRHAEDLDDGDDVTVTLRVLAG